MFTISFFCNHYVVKIHFYKVIFFILHSEWFTYHSSIQAYSCRNVEGCVHMVESNASVRM